MIETTRYGNSPIPPNYILGRRQRGWAPASEISSPCQTNLGDRLSVFSMFF